MNNYKTPVKIASLNVKGLGTPEKRSAIFQNLKRFNFQVLFMQQMYFQTGKIPRTPDRRYKKEYQSVSLDKRLGDSVFSWTNHLIRFMSPNLGMRTSGRYS